LDGGRSSGPGPLLLVRCAVERHTTCLGAEGSNPQYTPGHLPLLKGMDALAAEPVMK